MAQDIRTEKDFERFKQQWTDNMVKYWQERIDKLSINDTGRLRASISGMMHSGPVTTIEHQFLQYGIYVANGTGNGYRRGNGGNLEILDKKYRKQHGMGRQREPRDWVFRKFYSSRRVLSEMALATYGKAFQGMMTTALDAILKKVRVM